MPGRPGDHQNAVTEKNLKESIIDVAKICFGHAHPTARDWSVIVARLPKNSDVIEYIAHVVVYTTPNDLSRFKSLRDSGSAKDRIEALGDLLENLEWGIEGKLQNSRV